MIRLYLVPVETVVIGDMEYNGDKNMVVKK
jgi:hypothetical protein